MRRFTLAGAVLSAVVSSWTASPLASGQVRAAPPFTGVMSEGFETQTPAGFTACLPGRLFMDGADLCTPGGANLLLTPAWNYNCNMHSHGGNMFVGSRPGDWLRLSFDQPVSRFGGYFGSNGANGVVTARFFDASGHLVGRATPMVPAGCAWAWNGWETSGTPIATIEIENNHHAGGLVMLDDLEADPAQTPGIHFCTSTANSSGHAATISASGTPSLIARDLVLHASGLPANTHALFFYGPQRAQIPFGDGMRCIAGGAREIGRLALGVTGALGTLDHALDYANPPSPMTTIHAGSTWRFQAWFADPAAGAAGFSTSDGLEVQFSI